MLISIARFCTSFLLRLRYRINVVGYDDVVAKGKQGILFLPNHPAMIDPVILATLLYKDFKPHALVDERQLHGKIIRPFQKRLGVLPMTDMHKAGTRGAGRVLEQLKVCAETLQRKENLLFYPSGRLYHSQFECLKSNRGVKELFDRVPEARVVLIRTTGLWGSSFSITKGVQDSFDSLVIRCFKYLILNLLFFIPKRNVTVTFQELPEDFPRYADKLVLNRRLEAFYNREAPPNTYVPYYWWQGCKPRQMPEPVTAMQDEDLNAFPPEITEKVLGKLRELSGKQELLATDTLHNDLGLDSLSVAELVSWVQHEFACHVDSLDTLQNVGCVLLAATGQSAAMQPLKPVTNIWFTPREKKPLEVPTLTRITDIFLWHAQRHPKRVIMSDQCMGTLTYRKTIQHIMTVTRRLKKLPGDYIGILMPASAGSNVAYLSALFSGKTPVMINWTVGIRNMLHAVNTMNLTAIITSQTVIEKLTSQGIDFSGLSHRFIYMEDLLFKVSAITKNRIRLASYVSWSSLQAAKVPVKAVVLFTSGSENFPKAVPLTHKNLISDLKPSATSLGFQQHDRILCLVPPFHALGIWLNFMIPDLAGLQTVYYGNPMEGDTVAKLVQLYKASVVVGTPTFVSGIYRKATHQQLNTLRIVAVGAEACPQSLRDKVAAVTPEVSLLEGYGMTECGPVVAVNSPQANRPGTLGRPITGMQWTIRDENLDPVGPGEVGMLYLRGPCIFSGYLNAVSPTPFVMLNGETWYRTGDLVSYTEDMFLVYHGRMSRFVKIGGEMISLPALESTLDHYLTEEDDKAKTFAIENLGEITKPVITLFTTVPRDRETVNKMLAEAGFSPIHFIRKIVMIPEIPMLGSGKTDYRSLAAYSPDQDDKAA